ncbi:MAG: hypothetical protein ACI30W_03720 [Muribaculaceae bacterium]
MKSFKSRNGHILALALLLLLAALSSCGGAMSSVMGIQNQNQSISNNYIDNEKIN